MHSMSETTGFSATQVDPMAWCYRGLSREIIVSDYEYFGRLWGESTTDHSRHDELYLPTHPASYVSYEATPGLHLGPTQRLLRFDEDEMQGVVFPKSDPDQTDILLIGERTASDFSKDWSLYRSHLRIMGGANDPAALAYPSSEYLREDCHDCNRLMQYFCECILEKGWSLFGVSDAWEVDEASYLEKPF